ncbi:MAG TPA: two-component system sensor histidine kinase KdbD, partial [Plasticicumulans sp.]|nr:two-component system sensor histidine kinase KdbD [Plasticicumulans sp.]
MSGRPDPDALLALAQHEERRTRGGRLKVFLGAAPGVGKTWAMLEAAHAQREAGIDVVAGLVECHGRSETEALLDGLELLPRQTSAWHGVHLEEFDLDAALARRPALLLVDELAHSNAPGARHAKRWQDVQELLARGIDVYTTLNIQHLESLNDVVAGITGIIVRETVPDAVLEQADAVELVDLPPAELLARLRAGKVYLPAQAERAREHFFREANLAALRELALRQTAAQVNAQVLTLKAGTAPAATWQTAERILACVGPGDGARTVRAARRLAGQMHAEWTAVHVETPAIARRPAAERAGTIATLRLAEQLGGETLTLAGRAIADEILSHARARNVTRIVVGRCRRRGWRARLVPGLVDA